ncbi:RNA polymerase [Zwiesel bat bandavirus]|uniref:RNA-directed RNA polymerase L n=1 Tax=Zwiesel bat bandavirus TaxID=3071326 RepID=A0A6C0MAB2_9VIRU|nr:RNA polymerase [Zwiesel bat bandavirus]QHU78994.1 RNA polymerase [Zwiesel bat bandavirus]
MIKLSEAYKINHDFTFAGLSRATDRRLSEVFPLLHDGSDGMTPDVIHVRIDGVIVVIEFSTTRSLNIGGLEASFRGKMEKYREPIQRRVDIMRNARVFYGIIVVGSGGVLTNMPLEQDEAEELMFRFCIANEIFTKARMMDAEVELQKTEDELEAITRARSFFALFDPDLIRTEETFPNSDIKMLRKFLNEPIDVNYVTETLIKKEKETYNEICKDHFLKDGLNTSERLDKNRMDAQEKAMSLLDSLHQRSNKSEFSASSTVKIPPWLVKPQPGSISVDLSGEAGNVEQGDPYSELWSSAFLHIALGNVENVISNPAKELEIALDERELSDEDKSIKTKYHRFRPELSIGAKQAISLQGVEGKRWRNLAANQVKDKESHMTMSPFVDVSDIEDFLSHNTLMCDSGFDGEMPQTLLKILMDKASEIQNNDITRNLNAAFRRNLNSYVVQWALWVSCLAQELSAALRQHCRPGEFIIKKLMFWPIYVIIKPTKSSSHIFYSLAIKRCDIYKKLYGHVFTETIKSGEWEFCEFKSLKTCKLTNLVNLPCTMLNSIAFWREKQGVAPWMIRKADAELREQVAMSFLMAMEDKSTTEELVTLTRYTQMEGFVSLPLLPKPQKMVSKLDKPLRTKLQVFLLRRHLDAMVRVAGAPFKINAREGKVEWNGTFNAISGRTTSLENMVNNWYMGYYKNKEESTEINALGSMYKKIVEMEEERPITDEFLGWGDPETPEKHEFSRSMLKSACVSLEKEIEQRHGRTWKSNLEERILREIGSKNLLDLATMKASSNFSKDWEEFKEVSQKAYHRAKLLEKVSVLIEEGHVWYVDVLGKCWKAVLDDKCMRVCLFKKNQHGGLREIYVMDLNSRMIQFGVETMARCVCELSPHETIANPRLKNSIIENHGVKAARQIGPNSINVNSSNDAKKWNQGQYTTKLAMVLCWFLPPKFHRFVWCGISMFRRKKMMMDIRFLETICRRSETTSTDQFRQDLLDGFHGNRELPWIEKGKTYIQTETGMMQGILHYTSSLLHSCVQSFYKSLIVSRFKEGIQGRSIPVTVDVVEGSDDSAIMISFKAQTDTDESLARMLISVLLQSVRNLNPYFGIYTSEKSTINTLFCIEYNSEFHFHRHLVRPTLRWVAASHQISEAEALASRQEDYANLLTQCLEGGASFSLTYLIQCAQLLHHYMLLGFFLHPLFGTFIGMLIENPDPALGFFLLDNPVFAGGAGFRFNLWRACRFTSLGKKYAFYFNELQNKTKEDENYRALDSTTGGTLSHSVMIYWGDRKKYQAMLKKMGLPEDWVEQLDEDPSVLYRRPKTKAELILKLAEKVHSPGVISSLSKGHVVPRVVAAGVYLLSRHCFKTSASIHGKGSTQKASLIKLTIASSDQAMMNEGLLNPNQERMLFPQVQEYQRVFGIIDGLEHLKGKFVVKERNIVKSKIELFQEPVDLRCKAEDLIAEIWFGSKRTKLGPRLLQEEWDKLRASFSWLSSDHKETLEKGPFQSQVQFRNFIAHVDCKSRVVRLLGAPVKKSSGVTTVGQVVKTNFFPGFVLETEGGLDDHQRLESVGILKHYLFMTLNGPYTDEQKQKMIIEAFQSFDLPAASEVVRRSRTLCLCLIQNFINQTGGSILDQIEKAHSGTIGGFSKPQKSFMKANGSIGYRGKGVWTGIMEKTNVQLLIDGDGMSNWIEEVRLSTDSYLFDVIESIRRLCDDMSIHNRYTSDFRGQCTVRLSNFRVKPSSKIEGVAVIVFLGSFHVKELRNPDEVFIRVRGDILNLSLLLQEDRVMNLLSYRARDTDISEKSAEFLWINRNDFSFGRKEPSCSWMCMKTLDTWAWNRASKILKDGIKTPGIDNESLRGIFKDCLESSLRKQGLLKSKMAEMVERHVTPFTTQELMDILDEEVDFSDVLESDIITGTIEVEAIFEDSPMLWSAEIEEMGEGFVNLSHSGKYYHVGLMDQAAQTMTIIMGKDGCRQLLSAKVCNSKLREQIEPFLVLLDIDSTEIKWLSDHADEQRGLDEEGAEMWG